MIIFSKYLIVITEGKKKNTNYRELSTVNVKLLTRIVFLVTKLFSSSFRFIQNNKTFSGFAVDTHIFFL